LLLEINRKIATMGGGAILIVSKNRPLFVRRLSVFWGVLVHRKIRSPARKKNYWREDLGWTPYPGVTEPYSPWQQAAEGCICKVKRGSSCKMISTGSPRPLWDHCLELKALVRSCTCNDIYMTAGQVPETIMTGLTADISHIAEFGWYDWVMYRDNVLSVLSGRVASDLIR